MLERIRQIGHHYLFKIFFLILAIIFAVSLGNFSRVTNDNVVATVGKEKISINEFENARQRTIKQLVQEQQLSPEAIKASMMAINNNVINQLITQNLIKQEIKHLGIVVPEQILVETIHKDPNFQKDGKFDIEIYQQVLAANQLSEANLLESLADNVATRFLLESLVVNQPLKNNITDYLYDYLTEKRLVSLIKVDASQVDVGNFSDAELKAYYQKHPDQFQTKELRSFSYIVINDKNIKNNIVINDEEIQREYEENKEEYSLPETRDFYHFLTPSEEVAKKIAANLKNNKDHVKVAEEFIEHKVIGEKFINQSQQSFLSNLDPSLFKLNEDEITQAIKSDLGWHIFKVLKIHPKQYKNIAEASKEIKEKLTRKFIESQLYELSKQVEDEIASGADFKDIAQRYNLAFTQFENIALDDKKIDPKILATAFKINVNEESMITELSNNNGLFIVKLNAITEPKLQEFSSVQAQIKEFLAQEKRNNLAADFAKTLQEEVNKVQIINDSLVNSLSKKTKNPPKITFADKQVSRAEMGSDPEINAGLINSIFALKIKKASVPNKFAEAIYSFVFLKNILTDKTKDQQLYQQVSNLSEMNYKNEIYDQYIEYLKNKYSVKINLQLLE